MAKVDVEERAFGEPELKKASIQNRISRAEVMGYAIFLWRDSQQAGVSEASEADILSWLDIDRYSKPEKALKWLVKAGFLRELEPRDGKTWWKISGNETAVERTKIRIEKARNAASARYNRAPKCLEHNYKHSSEHASRMPYRNTEIQTNSIKPLNTPLQLVPSQRDIATAAVVKAAQILTMQASSGQNPEAMEKEAFEQIEKELGPSSLVLFKEKCPRWPIFTRQWYSAYKLGKQDKFEARLIRELRATAKVASEVCKTRPQICGTPPTQAEGWESN